MSNDRRGVALTPMETRRDVILRAAILADELGYEMFSVPEGWGFDSSPICAVDPDPARARHLAASLIVWYLSAMGDVYRRTVAAQGYASAVQAIATANPRPRLPDVVIPPEAEPVVDEFAASGEARRVRDRLESWAAAVDIVMLGLPAGMPWETIEATLRAAAPAG
jgi:alkanesulfonate monooxygenase SsuD/methylene tetrahydromethanopterin reductase-like flavin-dependent oxidoreductase (luciferase family)